MLTSKLLTFLVLAIVLLFDYSRATSVQIIAGAHNPTTTVNEPTQVRLVASAATIHAQWNRATLQNDIALLRAASIPVGSTGISAVSLAPASSSNFAGSTAVLSGWG